MGMGILQTCRCEFIRTYKQGGISLVSGWKPIPGFENGT